MGIDANIILQGKPSAEMMNPMDVAAKAINMKHLAQQAQAYDRESSQNEAMKNLYKKNVVIGADGTKSLNQKGVMSDLLDIAPDKHAEISKKFGMQNLEQLKLHTDQQSLLAQSIVDAPSYMNARSKALELKLPGSENLPEQYPGQQFVEKMKQATLSTKEQIDNHLKEKEFEMNSADKKDHRTIEWAKLGLEKDKASTKMGYTEGQKALDKDYAKDFNDWTSTGKASLDKNLTRLEEAKQALREDKSLTGSFRGMFPDFIRNTTNEKAIAIRDQVRAAAQGALKSTLGSAFTEKEGERIMNQAYNEKLSPEENIRKIEAAIEELQIGKENNEKKAQYFQQSGTLSGLGIPKDKIQSASNGGETVRMTDGKGGFFDIPKSQYGEAISSGLKKGG